MNGEGLSVVVLAGGTNSPEMEAATGVKNRALTPIGPKTMLTYVIDALGESASAGRIFVVGNVPPDAQYGQVAPGASLIENLLAGLEAAGKDADAVLVSTSDIPFLTPEAVDDFVLRAQESDADICLPYVSLDLCRERFPQMKRTALKLREGTFTLGNMAFVRPAVLLAHRDTIMAAYAARKSVWKLGRMLGAPLLLRVILSQTLMPQTLTVAALETSVTRLLGCRARGVISAHPEVGADVDKPEDVQIAREILAV